MRKTVGVDVLHEGAPVFVQLSDGSIRNGYTYKVLNMVRRDRTFAVSVGGINGANLEVVGAETHDGKADLAVTGDTVGTFRIYVTIPGSNVAAKTNSVYFTLTDKQDGTVVRSPALFAGPEQ